MELRVKLKAYIIQGVGQALAATCERAVYKGGVGADKNTLSQGSAVDRADARTVGKSPTEVPPG